MLSSVDTVSKTYRLNNGRDIPVIGLGTGGFAGAPQGQLVKQMVRDAVEAGYRLFDTAAIYGNERAIGDAVHELINEGKVKREELFLSTKIFWLMGQNQSISRAETLANVHWSLYHMNQPYLDLILFHFPSDVPEVNSEIWSGLEEALNLGLVKSIGVSNFNVTQLDNLIQRADVFPAMNQIESHPQLNQKQIIDFCTQYKIRVTAYSPLGAGSLIKDPTIVEIGNKHNKTSAQVMIRWQIQRGIVAIPKSTNKQRISDNINVFDFTLTDDEMKVLEDM